MYKWAVLLFVISIAGFALAINVFEDSIITVWLMIGSIVCLVLSFGTLMIDKVRADIKHLKKSWRIDQQYKHEKEAEKSMLVSNGEAKARYLKARKRHLLRLSSDDADGYITYDKPDTNT